MEDKAVRRERTVARLGLGGGGETTSFLEVGEAQQIFSYFIYCSTKKR